MSGSRTAPAPQAIPTVENKARGAEPIPDIPEIELENDKVEGDAISDSYALGWMGQFRDALQVEAEYWRNGDTPNFDYRSAIPEGYGAYADAYKMAGSQEQVDLITAQIDANLARRERRERRGTMNTLMSDVFTGIVSPEIFVGGPAVLGTGTLKGALKGGVAFGTFGAATEFVRTELDPTATQEEQIAGMGGALVLGTVTGGVLGTIGKGPSRGAGGAAARSVSPASLAPPVRGFRVTSRFGPRSAPQTARGRGSSNHLGVDFATPVGTPVTAQAEGVVEAITPASSGAGISVRINYGNGLTTRVLHLSETSVKVGDRVRPGQIYARTGNTGKSTGPHLHYEMHVNGKPVDPFSREAFEVAGTPSTPIAMVNALDGIAPPAAIEIDGRGVPVIIGPTGTGAAARFVRGKTAEQIVDEEVESIGRASAPIYDDAVDAGTPLVAPEPLPPANRFDAAGAYPNMPVKEAQAIAQRLAAEEGLVGIEALRRSRVIMGEMRQHYTGRTAQRARAAGASDFDLLAFRQSLLARADAAALRGDNALAGGLQEQAYQLRNDLEFELEQLDARAGNPDLTQAEAKALVDRAEAIRRALDDVEMAPTTLSNEGDDLLAARSRYAGRNAERVERERVPRTNMTRDQIRDAMRASELDGHDLPFGMSSTGSRQHTEDGDHILIDADAILASFKSKPWTTSNMEGVDAFPEDAFATPEDWLNFVVHHEVEHSVNPRMADETEAAYENRINLRAYQMVQEGNLPFSPSRNLVDRIAVAPTPRGRLERIIKDTGALIHRYTAELADDYAIQTVRSRQGGTSVPGGSVFQRTQRWIAHSYTVRNAINDEYLKLRGVPEDAPRLQKEAALGARALPGVRNLMDGPGTQSLADFRREVARAIVGFDDVADAAKAAAAKINRVTREMEEVQRELGMFQSTKGYRMRADRMERTAQRFEEMAGRTNDEWGTDLLDNAARLRGEAAELRRMADDPVMPTGEPNYYTRIWDQGAIEGRETELLQILERGYARVGHENPQAAAQGALDTIRMDPEGAMHMVGMPSSLKHRSIPVTNREVFDFIVQDPELVMNIYLRRVGGAIEMTRSFGDAFGLDAIDLMRADMLERGIGRQDIEAALQIFEDARDRIVGGFHASDPMSLNHRAVRAIKNVTNLIIYGKGLYSQVNDVARMIAVQGMGLRGMVTGHGSGRPAGFLGGVLGAVVGDLSRFSPGGNAKLAGEALDIVTARVMARLIEDDSALVVTKQTWLEKKLASAQAPFFYLNGMAPFSVIMKEMAGLVSGHNIINEATQVATAVRGGQAPDARVMARLKAIGIDEQDAMILADMPVERGKTGLILANVNEWEGARGDRARSVFLAAVNGEVRRSVITPGPLDRPAIFDGVFHTKKGRQAGLQAVEDAKRRVALAEQAFASVARLEEADPARIAALDALRAAKGELTVARRSVGRAGRIDAPFASLPFQAQSFAMGAASKMVAGLMSPRDRARVAGLVSLFAAGAISTWLKAGDYFENMTWEEFAAETFDNTGIGTWVGNLGKAVDTAMDNPFIPGNEFDRNDARVADEIGAAGPAVGIAAQLIEAFVSADMSNDDRVAAIRRSLPFANLIWLDGMLDTLNEMWDSENIEDPAYEGGSAGGETSLADDEAEAAGGGRFGVRVKDRRVPVLEGEEEDLSLPDGSEFVGLKPLPTNREVKAMKQDRKAERARPRRKPRLL